MENDNPTVDRPDSGVEDDSTEPEDEETQEMLDESNPVEIFRFRLQALYRQDSPQQPFNTQLPSLHTYLGPDLEVVRGRTVLDDGAIITLDLLHSPELILVPGQTLPLTVFDNSSINMLKNCIRNDRTFGVLASWNNGQRTIINNIGTTAEIYEFLPDNGVQGFRVKAKARQRFRVLEPDSSKFRAKVCILPEVKLPDALDQVKLHCLYRHRMSPRFAKRCKRVDAALTPWPAFIYEQYDINKLKTDIKTELPASLMDGKLLNDKESPAKVTVPEDPTELSFWIAQNMPMKEEHRLLLLKMNSPIQRLRWERRALQQCRQVLCCHFCKNVLGSSADIFSMSTEGPQATYVNPGGYLHETITLHKIRNVFSFGPPSTEFSWFPGYGWSICKCKQCNQHVGWKFIAINSQLKPYKFWGICRRSITVRMGAIRENGDDNQLPVF